MGRFAMLFSFAAVLGASCGTAVTGIYPYPVRMITLESISVPTQITDGETHTLQIEWANGAETFTTTWFFGSATTQTQMATSGPERESSVEVTFILDNIGPGTFNGQVQVVDERGNRLDQPFSYTVQAQT